MIRNCYFYISGVTFYQAHLMDSVTIDACSKTCLAIVLIRSIFARVKLHERFSANAVIQRKIERINTVARHVLR